MPTTSTMPRTCRGVGMNKSKKKKQVPVEPLQEPPAPMSPCKQAAPWWSTFEEQVSRATRSMSPDKSRVVRLYMEMEGHEEVCRIYRKCKRDGYACAKMVKEKMSALRYIGLPHTHTCQPAPGGVPSFPAHAWRRWPMRRRAMEYWD